MNKLKFCTNIIFIYNQRWNSLLEFLLLFLIAKRNETKTFLLSFKDTIISLERKSENLRRHRLISIDLEINLTISCRTVRETFAIYVVGYKGSCHNSRVDLWPREFRHREYDWFPPHWTIVGGEMEITTFPVYIYMERVLENVSRLHYKKRFVVLRTDGSILVAFNHTVAPSLT